MTREEKIDMILTQMDDNDKLRAIVRFAVKQAIANASAEQVDLVFYALNQELYVAPEPPPEE